MPTSLELADAIDAFMAERKTIIGFDVPPRWGTGYTPHERVMKYPLEIEGEQRDAQLMIVCFPREPELRFRIGILFPAMICRIDCTDETHPNSISGAASGDVPPIVTGPHYHSWPLNRRFFKGSSIASRLHDATPFAAAGSFDGCLRWFCADTGIESLPPGHRIELPGLDLLI